MPEGLRDLVGEALVGGGRVLAFTGAGISAESGVPTFRGEDGLWRNHRPEELATPEAFGRDPELVWEWYDWRRRLVAACSPNEAHRALAEGALAGSLHVVTQNVDGLHARALAEAREESGGIGEEPIELHGSLFRVRCTSCGRRFGHPPSMDESAGHGVPRCQRCGGALRPDVVWFGEALDSSRLDEAVTLAQDCRVCLSIGTSSLVFPAAQVPLIALESGATVIEVNPNATPLTPRANYSLSSPAAEAVPALLGGLAPARNPATPGGS